MENLASDLVQILRYLLPGFLAAWVFYGFTSFVKPSQFERVVQALIFTLIVQVVVYIYRATVISISEYWTFGSWDRDIELVVSVAIAAILGFTFSYFSNNDKFHSVVRKIGASKETSYPSEWYGEFSNRVTYIVLHLDGERRLYGWPKEWPSNSEKGHFSIEQASWLVDGEEIPITGVETILIPAKDVRMVEFMEKTWE
ncbi:DUF6338 family protein [Marinimicrobium agarilyticum]|uniref:DUF6338 family protein n=1 Tax=Marinimicrobium agarilyticum TaxID=306546 RepID=UPI0004234F69|nr:DUF6338 family protein [Marinimicrobium agarilyticum]